MPASGSSAAAGLPSNCVDRCAQGGTKDRQVAGPLAPKPPPKCGDPSLLMSDGRADPLASVRVGDQLPRDHQEASATGGQLEPGAVVLDSGHAEATREMRESTDLH